jgi:hypothetical protein
MREPEKQSYDLVVDPGATATFFEIKTFSKLGSHQIQRQLEHLKNGQNVHYVLLGRTATEWPHDAMDAETNGRSKKISYKELIRSLQNTSGIPIAEAYGIALEQQRERIRNQFGDPDI